MTALLHHVSTRDRNITKEEILTSMRMIDETRRVLSISSTTNQTTVDDEGVRTMRIGGSSELEIAHQEIPDGIGRHPTRRVRLVDGREGHGGRRAAFRIDSCMKPYGSIRPDDQGAGIEEILDMVECALRTAPLTPGRMSPRLRTVMDGVAWIRNSPEDESARAGLPWMWLAPSAVRGMRLNAIEQPWDLHTPLMCCLGIAHGRDGLDVSLTGLAGHTFDRSMTAIDGMRAVRELEEWRAEDLGGSMRRAP